jgi:hypothetical protein
VVVQLLRFLIQYLTNYLTLLHCFLVQVLRRDPGQGRVRRPSPDALGQREEKGRHDRRKQRKCGGSIEKLKVKEKTSKIDGLDWICLTMADVCPSCTRDYVRLWQINVCHYVRIWLTTSTISIYDEIRPTVTEYVLLWLNMSDKVRVWRTTSNNVRTVQKIDCCCWTVAILSEHLKEWWPVCKLWYI